VPASAAARSSTCRTAPSPLRLRADRVEIGQAALQLSVSLIPPG
jgi:hypothetical protein